MTQSKKYKIYSIPILFLLLGVIASFHTLHFYTQVDGLWLSYAAMLFLPIILYIENPAKKSNRFAYLSMASLALFVALPSHLILLFAFYCFAFFVVESHFGQLNKLALFLLVLASPIAYYLFEIFGFNIRLYLTKFAAVLLNLGGMTCQVQGNLMEVNGDLFSVDPVCMGLNMVMTSMLGALILISFYEKQHKISLSYLALSLCIFLALLLVVLANLFRILGIVLTKAAPETFLHEAIGLISMVLFVLVPLYFCVPFVYKYFNHSITHFPPLKRSLIPLAPFKGGIKQAAIDSRKQHLTLLFLLAGMAYGNIVYPQMKEDTLDQQTSKVEIEGYDKHLLTFPNGYKVVQYLSDESLVYIKPQHPYRVTNHNPLICWQGSGYEIKNEDLMEVGDQKVFTAQLVSEEEQLFTAWWYDNGSYKTTAHLDWRFRMMKGETPFRMVNVSAADFSSLYQEVDYLLGENLFD